jgi:hypothetical protein
METETLTDLAETFERRAADALARSTRCANEQDAAGLLANEYERTAWLRAARELRAAITAGRHVETDSGAGLNDNHPAWEARY